MTSRALEDETYFHKYLKETISEEEIAQKVLDVREIYLQPLSSDSERLQERMGKVCDYFLPGYARADLLALKYQGTYRLASKSVFILSALAVIIISGQYIFSLSHWLVALELLAMATILMIIIGGNKVGWHRRWVDYRFLAERHRSAIFMTFFSEKGATEDASSFICRWVGESWCLHYFVPVWQDRPKLDPVTDPDLPDMNSFFDRAWLEEQRSYHERRALGLEKKHHDLSSVGTMFFWLTFLAAFFHLLPHLLHLFHLELHPLHDPLFNRVMTFFAVAFPALGAACAGLRAHFDSVVSG